MPECSYRPRAESDVGSTKLPDLIRLKIYWGNETLVEEFSVCSETKVEKERATSKITFHFFKGGPGTGF